MISTIYANIKNWLCNFVNPSVPLTFGHSGATSSPSQPIISADLWSQWSTQLTQSTHYLRWPLVTAEHPAHTVNPSVPLTFGHSGAPSSPSQPISSMDLWSQRSTQLTQSTHHLHRPLVTAEHPAHLVNPSSLAAGVTTRHFQVGDTGSQVLERLDTRLSGRRLPSCRPWSSWLTVSRQYNAGHPSYDDVTGRQNICRRRTACLEQPSSCHPWSVTVAVNLRKAAENLFVCLRVAALVTYELAPWKCTD